jgi:hypothetical protein
MRTTGKAILTCGILGAIFFGGIAPVLAQYYYPPYPPPPPPPPPYYGYRYGPPPGAYQPPSPRWRTINGCPPHYTVQDGLCKPYRGY